MGLPGPAGRRRHPDATSFGLTTQDDAFLSTQSLENGVQVDVFMTGTNTSQPMGTKGRVRIQITNNSGGTIKGGPNGLEIHHVLPAEYVMDTTFDPVASVSPAYGNAYPGMLAERRVDQPGARTRTRRTRTTPRCCSSNTAPEFLVTSNGAHPNHSVTRSTCCVTAMC